MGLNGTILIYPTGGRPSAAPDLELVVKRVIKAFENHGLLLPDTIHHCKIPRPWNRVFAEYIDNGVLANDECASFQVNPDRISPKLSELVFLLDVDTEDQPTPIELPYIEFSVITKPLPIINGYDGSTLATTWAIVGFSYEDVRYNENIHRIRNEQHPIFLMLSEIFSSPIGWAVQIG